jgi:hypothetical protein
MKDFAKVYRRCSNGELACLYYDVASLTESAKAALSVEIHQRGLTPHALAALSRQQAQNTATRDEESQQTSTGVARFFGRRIAIRFAMVVVGSLLVIGLAMLTTGKNTPEPQPTSNSQR